MIASSINSIVAKAADGFNSNKKSVSLNKSLTACCA
jgi:hypothetical protein